MYIWCFDTVAYCILALDLFSKVFLLRREAGRASSSFSKMVPKYWILKLAPWYTPLFHERPRLTPPRKDHNTPGGFIVEFPTDVQDFSVWLPIKTTTLSTSFSIIFLDRPFGKIIESWFRNYIKPYNWDDSRLLKIVLIFSFYLVIHLFIHSISHSFNKYLNVYYLASFVQITRDTSNEADKQVIGCNET